MSLLQVKNLLNDVGHGLKLSLLAGRDSLWKPIETARFFKAGLVLTGVEKSKGTGGIIVLGFMEISYLASQEGGSREQALSRLFELKPTCIIVAKNLTPPPLLLSLAEEQHVPLLSSTLPTGEFLDKLSLFLEEATREITRVHGVLLDVLGIGVLLVGKSGIGKSEVALELITRGQRLVADDTVEIHKHHPATLEGMGTPVVKHHMEIRGLGIISIQALFGPTAVRDRKKIELVVELEEWIPEKEYERLGLDEEQREILGVPVPCITLPVRPGRSIATIVEVAARDRLLKQRGIHSARAFQRSLNQALNSEDSTVLFEEDIE